MVITFNSCFGVSRLIGYDGCCYSGSSGCKAWSWWWGPGPGLQAAGWGLGGLGGRSFFRAWRNPHWVSKAFIRFAIQIPSYCFLNYICSVSHIEFHWGSFYAKEKFCGSDVFIFHLAHILRDASFCLSHSKFSTTNVDLLTQHPSIYCFPLIYLAIRS